MKNADSDPKVIKRFVTHGVPVEIRFDDEVYSEAESKRMIAQFIMLLHGIDC